MAKLIITNKKTGKQLEITKKQYITPRPMRGTPNPFNKNKGGYLVKGDGKKYA